MSNRAALENIVVGFTCPECENEETVGLDALVVIGTPICSVCDYEMDADTTADILPSEHDEPLQFDLSKVEVGFNGDKGDPWIDMTFHEDERPIDMPSIVAHLGMRPDDVLSLRDRLFSVYQRATS